MPTLPMTPFERTVKKAGLGRVSREALEETREIIDDYANRIAEEAVRLARHSNRKTVMKEDIEFVVGREKK